MMSGGRPAWLPLHLPVTPPVADLIEERTGVRSPELAFETDFGCEWVGFNESPQPWREALAGLGCPLPVDAEIGPFRIAHLAPPAGTTGVAQG